MNLAVPRGIIYHHILCDFKYLFKALYSNLKDQTIILKFEKAFSDFIGSPYCLAFPYARTAIYFSLKTCNFPRGSEIIMPPISIKGILDVVLDCGLIPVFVDIDPNTLCFDSKKLKKAITSKTKAIIVTYLYGIVPNIKEIITISKGSNLFVIEDFSQCLNGKFKSKKIGTFGDVGVYSASSIKTLDTYGGGLLICKNKKLFLSLSKYKDSLSSPGRWHLITKILTDLIRNLATNRIIFTCFVFPLLRLLNFIKPGSIIKQTGDRDSNMISSLPKEWFYAFSSVQANAGLFYLPKINNIDKVRIENVKRIKSATSIIFPRGTVNSTNVYWQLIAFFSDPQKTQQKLHLRGIDTARSSLLNISNLPAYPYRKSMPHAENLYRRGLFIPSYHSLSKKDIKRIIDALNQVYTRNG
jgi:perosamine synthetase